MSKCDFWVSVKGFEGYLMVNTDGEIRSVTRVVCRSDTRTPVTHIGVVIAQQTDKNGYRRVRVSVNRSQKTLKVHRVVAKAFLRNPENKPQVNHKNGHKSDNRMSNLEWSTNGENQSHAIETGLKWVTSGSESPRFTGSVSAYRDGVFVCEMSGNSEMRENGFDYRLVSAVLLGKRKKHMGCTFVKNSI